ncbi:mediator of RNA polymerase II transcription subunit 31 isoform X1 [Anthonomus grandis grandis]|uniref:mediator of RNA polymerase II transcription subunit 31 isoform X1 n=1 Tax=Anthonomus grandis grandis TaxID=2921223 RepID=UPI0021660DB1|nr:mediator of RNA polymerase II transcription subunit 31 isoform X1 [Anthonomus grandis grandis]
MAGMAGKGWSYVPGVPETEDQQKIRFQVELEFVQCLGNPNYLNFLAQRGFMKESTFINYLKYLLYWKEPEYAKYLKYPMCLYFLDLLQYEHFRRELVNAQCTKFIDDQQILLWQHYTRRRSRLMATAAPNGANQEQNTSLPPSNAQQNGHINMNTKMS